MEKKALIILNGGIETPESVLRWNACSDRLIAADGGSSLVAMTGATPDAIVGDMDSSDESVLKEFSTSTIVRDDDQTRTDFQKAIAYAVEEVGATNVVVLNSDGDRLDHSISALGWAATYSERARIRFVYRTSIVHLVRGEFTAQVRIGCTVSVIPILPNTSLESVGLKWPLDGLKLSLGSRDGVSNEATSETLVLHVTAGCAAVFIQRFDGDVQW